MEYRARSPFSRGCAMAWAEGDYDEDGELLYVELHHCRCPGYQPAGSGAANAKLGDPGSPELRVLE